MDVTEFATTHNIAATAKFDSSKSGRNFKVTLRFDGRQMTVPFFQGSAWTTDPTAADVLNCLALDSSGYENAGSFEDWADEYGMSLDYADDVRAAKKTYQTVERQAKRLDNLLGNYLYNELLWETDSL
jgi:hypothetical protein